MNTYAIVIIIIIIIYIIYINILLVAHREGIQLMFLARHEMAHFSARALRRALFAANICCEHDSNR
jgi:ATP/ADP translocase